MVLSRMGHWPTSAEAWTQLVADRAPDLRPKHWSHAVIAQRKNSDPIAAEAVLDAALEHCPRTSDHAATVGRARHGPGGLGERDGPLGGLPRATPHHRPP